jgi:hypothetical protein
MLCKTRKQAQDLRIPKGAMPALRDISQRVTVFLSLKVFLAQ